jgi:hypothetical protein
MRWHIFVQAVAVLATQQRALAVQVALRLLAEQLPQRVVADLVRRLDCLPLQLQALQILVAVPHTKQI